MPHAQLVVKDQCNIKFNGLELELRQLLTAALRYEVPNARFTPQYKLGRWDGTVSFCTATSGTYLNLLDRLLPLVYSHGYDIEINDQRPVYNFRFDHITDDIFADKTWPPGHDIAGEPIMLRDYQVEAINIFLDHLQSVQEIATGSGKTVMCAALSYLCQQYGRTVVIVPSKSLVLQTEEDYRNVGLDVGVYYGKRKELGHTHTIATWQSLGILDKNSRRDEVEIPIDDLVKDVICVIGDECHTCKGKVLRDLLTGPFAKVPIRWGLTGTIPPEEHEWMCLLSAFGPKVGEIKSYDLQDLGVLAESQIDIIQLVDDHVGFRDYNSEHDFLMSDSLRLTCIAKMIEMWSAANTMVLVDRIETGKILQTLVPDSVFICGDTKEQARKFEYDSIRSADGKVIIATYGVLSTGINLPRIFNVVFIEPGKSFIRVIQSLGRGLRKTQDKSAVRVFDVCSTLKFSARHLSKRKGFYTEYRHPFTSKRVTYL